MVGDISYGAGHGMMHIAFVCQNAIIGQLFVDNS